MIGLIWAMTKGYRLRPWASPYLRWRLETYWGLHADQITPSDFFHFCWQHRAELFRYVRWAARQKG